ncbi:uncharacterized protein LOC132740922 [Ruditapes philippinarum]|uniref:uncharacterized protein LOC132740922 n=1 Tax=Ruditapes philippinarum TaxID=129788 RepID=UPI00295BC644|nr:uncharacterized protein LOC132740922 [Ruditapes philippinarum]
MSYHLVVFFISLYVFGFFQVDGIRHFCGSILQPYNTDIEECIEGEVVSKTLQSTTQSGLTETDSLVQTADPLRNRVLRRPCIDYDDILRCNGKIHCGRHEGYKCCGFESYNPNHQTCCQQSSAMYRIHDDKPEKSHICCQLDVHIRGSKTTPCAHVANNDMFLQKPRHLKNLRNDQRLCRESFHVFRIDLRSGGRGVTAVVLMWDWKPSKKKLRLKKSGTLKKNMRIKFDKYSKPKNIAKNSFLVVSKYNYSEDSYLYLKANDVLYRCPKKHKNMMRILRKIQNKCLKKQELLRGK